MDSSIPVKRRTPCHGRLGTPPVHVTPSASPAITSHRTVRWLLHTLENEQNLSKIPSGAESRFDPYTTPGEEVSNCHQRGITAEPLTLSRGEREERPRPGLFHR